MDGEFRVKECGACEEIMPTYEKLCYCGGPVKLVRATVEKKKLAESYSHRKWLNSRRCR